MNYAMQIKSTLMLAFFSFFMLSCVSTLGCVGCNTNSSRLDGPWSMKPQESFGLVEVVTKIDPMECMWRSSHAPQEEKCNLKSLGIASKTATSIGSSIIVGHQRAAQKTYLLSAAHVCSDAGISMFEYTTPEGKHSAVYVQKSVKEIQVYDYDGKARSGRIYRLDIPNDLCIIEASGVWGKSFKVSSIDPVVGERTYNVASPHKIWAPGMVLMLEGLYSGRSPEGFYHFTIPARPGSSGSPILNKRGEIVGVIQRAVAHFENIAISTSTQAIREIVSSLPEDKTPLIEFPSKIEIIELF